MRGKVPIEQRVMKKNPSICIGQKNLGVAGRVADYAQTPTMHEGRGDDGRLRVKRRAPSAVPPRCKKKFKNISGGHDHIILPAIERLGRDPGSPSSCGPAPLARTEQLRNITLCWTFTPCPSRLRETGIGTCGRSGGRPRSFTLAGVHPGRRRVRLPMACWEFGDAEGPRRPHGVAGRR